MAQQGHHQAADLVRGRPARRQPGADRADGFRPQDADVQAALPDGLQGDRGRLPGRLGDRFRLRARADRAEDDPRRRHHPGADAEPAGADRAHLRGLPRRQARHRPSLQLDLDPAAPRRVRHGLQRHHRHRRVGRQAGQAAGRRRSQHRMGVRIFAGELHRHRARVRARHLRRGRRRLPADAAEEDDHQPAGDGRDGLGQHLCRPDRMVPSQLQVPRCR